MSQAPHSKPCSVSSPSLGAASAPSPTPVSRDVTPFTSRVRGKHASKASDGSDGRGRIEKSAPQPASLSKLVCPFHARDRGRKPKRSSCMTPGFSSISRVKEHLHRVHSTNSRCPRCHTEFEDDDQYNEHLMLEVRCDMTEDTDVYRDVLMSKALQKKLRSKKRVPGVNTYEERWGQVYRILFGDSEPIPDPHVRFTSRSGDVSQAKKSWARDHTTRLHRRLAEQIGNAVPGIHHVPRELLEKAMLTIMRECDDEEFGHPDPPAAFDASSSDFQSLVQPDCQALGSDQESQMHSPPYYDVSEKLTDDSPVAEAPLHLLEPRDSSIDQDLDSSHV